MNKKLFTAKQVREIFGSVSDMTLWRWIKCADIDFPKPMYINGRRYFDVGEIEVFRDASRKKTA